MYVRAWDRTQYPKFTAYMRDSFPTLLDVPNIVSGMRSWGHMTMEEIKTALSWQEGDVFTTILVDIREVSQWEQGAGSGALRNEIRRGATTFGEALVSPKAVQAFERGCGVSRTAYGRKVYSVGAQILGQIVYFYASNHYWSPRFNGEPLNALARSRRQGFFNQVYGGTPR